MTATIRTNTDMSLKLVSANESGQATTTSLAIAEGVGNPHSSVIKLIRQNVDDLGDFGLLDFKSRSSGGRSTEYTLLNEQQATLLITYMRNNDVVRAFKKRLVKAFFEFANVHRSIPQSYSEVV